MKKKTLKKIKKHIALTSSDKCALCGNIERLTPYMGNYICSDCLKALKKELRL